MTDYELDLEIAREIPGWHEVSFGGPYPPSGSWFTFDPIANEVICRPETSKTSFVWSPATNLNQAAEAVRAICNTPAKVVAWSMEEALGGTSFAALAGPRAWCLALVAVGGAK